LISSKKVLTFMKKEGIIGVTVKDAV